MKNEESYYAAMESIWLLINVLEDFITNSLAVDFVIDPGCVSRYSFSSKPAYDIVVVTLNANELRFTVENQYSITLKHNSLELKQEYPQNVASSHRVYSKMVYANSLNSDQRDTFLEVCTLLENTLLELLDWFHKEEKQELNEILVAKRKILCKHLDERTAVEHSGT